MDQVDFDPEIIDKADLEIALQTHLTNLTRQNHNLLQANRDCAAWFHSLVADHQKALKTLDELARLGNGKEYGNSTGNTIAQRCLHSLID